MLLIIALLIMGIIFPLWPHVTSKVMYFLVAVSAVISYGLSTDFFTYIEIFEVLNTERYSEQWSLFYYGVEPSYYLASRLFGSIGANGHAVIAFFQLIIYYFIYKGCRLISKEPLFLVVFSLVMVNTFYFMGITFVRQAAAAAIIFYGVCLYLSSKSIWKYSLLVLFATFFHVSAFLCIFTPLIVKWRVRYTPIKLIFGLFLLSVIMLLNPFSLLEPFLPNELAKFGKYLSGTGLVGGQFIYSLVNTVVLASIFLFIYNKGSDFDDEYFVFANLFVAILVVRILSINIGSLSRIVIYFYLFISPFLYFYIFEKLSFRFKILVIYLLVTISIFKVYSLTRVESDINSFDSMVVNFCFFGEPCEIKIYGDTMEAKHSSF